MSNTKAPACIRRGCTESAPHIHMSDGTSKALRDAVGSLPVDSAERKAVPLARGVLDYFPAALAAVAELSRAGNDKHNPGEELHWSRNKSGDHADCILRHLVDRGVIDPEDGILHDVKVAWRALALLQEELEKRGAPRARAARVEQVVDNGCVALTQPLGGYGPDNPCLFPDCHLCHPSRFA